MPHAAQMESPQILLQVDLLVKSEKFIVLGAIPVISDALRQIGFQCKFAAIDKDLNKIAGRILVA